MRAAICNSISYAFDKIGVYSLTLRVFNAFGGVAVKEFSVTATEPVETGIEIETEPTKTTYKVSENLSLEGLSVKVLYEGGATRVLDSGEYEVTGFDSSEAGTVTLTVEYLTFTDTFTVTVENLVLESIEINVKPTKTKYVLGTELDISGMIVKAKYDTGDSKTITDYTVSGYDKNTLGEQTMTVTYEGKKATFKVTVTNDRRASNRIGATSIARFPPAARRFRRTTALRNTSTKFSRSSNDRTTS